MSDSKLYPVFESIADSTHLNKEQYEAMYQRSIAEPDEFWAEQAEQYLDWYSKWDKVSDFDFNTAQIKWFEGGKLNVSYNCIDRHLKDRADQTALIWEGDNPDQSEHISYQKLHDEVCKLANALKANGAEKGDRICLYMPMIPEGVKTEESDKKVTQSFADLHLKIGIDSLKQLINNSLTVKHLRF